LGWLIDQSKRHGREPNFFGDEIRSRIKYRIAKKVSARVPEKNGEVRRAFIYISEVTKVYRKDVGVRDVRTMPHGQAAAARNFSRATDEKNSGSCERSTVRPSVRHLADDVVVEFSFSIVQPPTRDKIQNISTANNNFKQNRIRRVPTKTRCHTPASLHYYS